MPRALADRITVLERQMQQLQELPGLVTSLDARVALLDARVASLETQFLQFREEVKGEFLRVEGTLRAEIRVSDEETRRYMRVLHEEVIARIVALAVRTFAADSATELRNVM